MTLPTLFLIAALWSAPEQTVTAAATDPTTFTMLATTDEQSISILASERWFPGVNGTLLYVNGDRRTEWQARISTRSTGQLELDLVGMEK